MIKMGLRKCEKSVKKLAHNHQSSSKSIVPCPLKIKLYFLLKSTPPLLFDKLPFLINYLIDFT